MKRPRKLKKQIKKAILVYDLGTLPTWLSMTDIRNNLKNSGIVMWASSAAFNRSGKENNNAPKIYGKNTRLRIIDVSK